MLSLLIILPKECMYNTNRTGPSKEPCGALNLSVGIFVLSEHKGFGKPLNKVYSKLI